MIRKQVGRYSEKEAKAIAALLMSVGMVGANGLRMFKISKRRALELEAMKPTAEESAFILKQAKRK